MEIKMSKEVDSKKATKIGIFGGSFNPVHVGHLNSLRAVAKREKLKKIFVVPNAQNPLKTSDNIVDGKHRLAMLELALKDDPQFVVDDQEIKRGGKSYAIETLRYYISKYSSENIYLILGADSFENFDQWKNFEEILQEVNIIVTSRPKAVLPYDKEDFPKGVQPHIKDIDFKGVVKLKGGRTIRFAQLDDIDVSSTQIRKNLKLKKNVDQFLTFEVEKYIKENDVFPPLEVKIPDFREFVHFCAQNLADKKALGIKAFDLTQIVAPSEYAVVASGTSTKQAQSFAEQLARKVKEEYGVDALTMEGLEEGRWVVIDYGSLIVHVFYDFVRNEYRIEDLWKTGKEIQLKLK